MLPTCETLRLQQSGCVLHMTFDRPEVRNALNTQMWNDISAVFSRIHDDRSIRAVVVRGAGGNFCAGGDLKERAAIAPPGDARAQRDPLWERNRMGGRILTQILRAPQVVIAAVEGAALGGGLGLVCIADIALCTSAARFALPEVSLGIVPAQISPFLVQRLGQSHARRLALTAASIEGVEAHRIGLVHELCADGPALDAAVATLERHLARCAPRALTATKELIALAETTDLETHLDSAATTFLQAARGVEGMEGASAFRDKRQPSWTVDS